MPWLADTSTWTWRHREPQVSKRFVENLLCGDIWTCEMVKLELLYEVRSGDEFDQRLVQLNSLSLCPIGATEWTRALDVYRELAGQGGAHQRSVNHQDLLIAAAAESAEVSVLHYDEDFDRIAAVTGQPVEWIAPRGSL